MFSFGVTLTPHASSTMWSCHCRCLRHHPCCFYHERLKAVWHYSRATTPNPRHPQRLKASWRSSRATTPNPRHRERSEAIQTRAIVDDVQAKHCSVIQIISAINNGYVWIATALRASQRRTGGGGMSCVHSQERSFDSPMHVITTMRPNFN